MTSLPGPPRRGGVSQIRIRPPRRLRRDYFFRGAQQARALSRTASLAIHNSRGPAAKGLPGLRAKTAFLVSSLFATGVEVVFQAMAAGAEAEPYGGEDIYQSGGDFYSIAQGNVLYAIAVGIRRTGRRRKRCCGKSIASNSRCSTMQIKKCLCAVSVISLSSGRLSTALSHPAGPSRRDQRDTRIRP